MRSGHSTFPPSPLARPVRSILVHASDFRVCCRAKQRYATKVQYPYGEAINGVSYSGGIANA
ncbi:hypothetical protein GL4_0814 [Methyloceanibacter caenitepidi]|uniref:Uncharacterized protein n=1 Tax=Methyloceanibacter caenitepidi TaxID=1384459 RepID=A0A0A8K0E4_9HYPH|nr:hypothetical protein GL4_0814 [Methyloceanibacter caenitepidi]